MNSAKFKRNIHFPTNDGKDGLTAQNIYKNFFRDIRKFYQTSFKQFQTDYKCRFVSRHHCSKNKFMPLQLLAYVRHTFDPSILSHMAAGEFNEVELAYQIGSFIVPKNTISSYQIEPELIQKHISKYSELLTFIDQMPENQTAEPRSEEDKAELAMSYLSDDFFGLLRGQNL